MNPPRLCTICRESCYVLSNDEQARVKFDEYTYYLCLEHLRLVTLLTFMRESDKKTKEQLKNEFYFYAKEIGLDFEREK